MKTLISYKVAKLLDSVGYDCNTEHVFELCKYKSGNYVQLILAKNKKGIFTTLPACSKKTLKKWIKKNYNLDIHVVSETLRKVTTWYWIITGESDDLPLKCIRHYSEHNDALDDGLYECLMYIIDNNGTTKTL